MNEENIVFNSEDVQNNKVMGILAYFGILFLIPLLAAKIHNTQDSIQIREFCFLFSV